MAKFSFSRDNDEEEAAEEEEGSTQVEGDSSTVAPPQKKQRRSAASDPTETPDEDDRAAEPAESGWKVTLTDPEVLDCAICMEPLSPPVFQCENGHIACSPCCSKLRNRCPSCSWPIGYNRCLAIEKVIESIKVPCKNRPYGCKDSVIFNQKLAHEMTCTYSPCMCPIFSCEFCGSSKQLSDHFTIKHQSRCMRFVYNSLFSVSFSKLDPYIVFQEEDGRLFVLSHELRPTGSAITVTCLGEKSLNKGFFYELTSRKGDSFITLQSEMKYVTQRDESVVASGSSMCFLFVPCTFYSSGKLKLEVCIRESAEDASHP